MKKFMLLILTLVILSTTALAFDDLEGHWAYGSVMKWSNFGVLKGDSDTLLFRPDEPVRRGEFAVVLDRIFAFGEVSENIFSDLPEEAFYTKSVLGAHKLGIMSGDPAAGLMRPDENVTREEAAVLLARAFNIAAGTELKFTDLAQFGDWSLGFVSGMTQLGYISGRPDGSFGPKDSITRAELARLLDRMVDTIVSPNSTATIWRYGCVVINSSDITVSGLVEGDLIIGHSATNVILNDLQVTGKITLCNGQNGLVFKGGSDCGSLVLMNTFGIVDILSPEGEVLKSITSEDFALVITVFGPFVDSTVRASSRQSEIISVTAMPEDVFSGIPWEGLPNHEAVSLEYAVDGSIITASGELSYVEDFTGFGSDAEMQHGYYAALYINIPYDVIADTAVSKGVIFTLTGTKESSFEYSDNVIRSTGDNYRIEIFMYRASQSDDFSLTLDWDGDGAKYKSTTYVFDMSGVGVAQNG